MLTAPEASRRVLPGVVASTGYAEGPLWIPTLAPQSTYAQKESAELETLALRQAIDLAHAEILDIVKRTKSDAKDILEFQKAVFEDNTFFDEAIKQIAVGKSALQAWNIVLQTEIAGYQSAADEVFRNRSIDIEDIQSRVSQILCNQSALKIPSGAILLSDSINPSAFITHDWKDGGIALTQGSPSSHIAILARQFEVPLLVGMQAKLDFSLNGKNAILRCDASEGCLIISPNSLDKLQAKGLPGQVASDVYTRASIKTGHDLPIKLMINLAHLRELDHFDVRTVDGIGLVRTEFLFAGEAYQNLAENEDAQFKAYCRILSWAKGKPVYIRTIDAGGDKQPMSTALVGGNSKLRGLARSLAEPEIFKVQIRALLRAALFGQLHVTLPMVTSVADFNSTLALFNSEAERLAKAGIVHTMPPIGIMVEVPEVANSLLEFAQASHFSIGTNDLIQFAMDEPRDKAGLKSTVAEPQVMALIKKVVSSAKILRKPVNVCGDAASQVTAVGHLLSAGITAFSVSPPDRAAIFDAIYAYFNGRKR